MKIKLILISALALLLGSCSSTRSGSSDSAGHDVFTYSESINNYDLDVAPEAVTYTIDISSPEGALKLKGLNLNQAKQLALEEAAIVNNAARIVSPKYTFLKKGKHILRITVFGFPARYRNAPRR